LDGIFRATSPLPLLLQNLGASAGFNAQFTLTTLTLRISENAIFKPVIWAAKNQFLVSGRIFPW
jgi:hypothetical protein